MSIAAGAWVHTPAAPEQTDALIAELAERGIRRVCAIAKGPSGTTFYPSGLAYTEKGYEDAAVYGRLVERCRRAGIAVEVWICTFTEGGRSRFLDEHPECRGRSAGDSTVREDCEAFVCPAQERVHEHELALCREALGRFPGVARLHLDYIRYPWSNGTVCRCRHCCDEFRRKTGFDLTRDVIEGGDRENPGFEAFVAWRCEHIRRFVERARALAKDCGVGLSAAVFPFYPSIMFDLGQDWVEWCRAGLLDAVYPMTYNSSPLMVGRYTSVHVSLLSGLPVQLCEGLWIRDWMDEARAGHLVHAALDAGAPGIMFFTGQSLARLSPGFLPPLTEGPRAEPLHK
ncbi:MAG: hypothetical protein BWZ02_03308 [Lentisphaerae bacterium ADurb.BinA184]|nr:MAG: hypothetical protein BWZ02_03308 [Lentisphaerae bacterium ADurb.BinA184]